MNKDTPYSLSQEVLLLEGWTRSGHAAEVSVPDCASTKFVEDVLYSGLSQDSKNNLIIKRTRAIANDMLFSEFTQRLSPAQRQRNDDDFDTVVLESLVRRGITKQRIEDVELQIQQGIQVQ